MRAILLAAQLLIAAGPAAAAEKPEVDFKKLSATCESDWSAYINDVDGLKERASRWVQSESKKNLESLLLDKYDPLVIFISGTWPELFDGKMDDDWKSWKDCARKHWALRQDIIRDRSTSAESRQLAVDRWRDCLQGAYLNSPKIIQPLNDISLCYRKQAVTFKD